MGWRIAERAQRAQRQRRRPESTGRDSYSNLLMLNNLYSSPVWVRMTCEPRRGFGMGQAITAAHQAFGYEIHCVLQVQPAIPRFLGRGGLEPVHDPSLAAKRGHRSFSLVPNCGRCRLLQGVRSHGGHGGSESHRATAEHGDHGGKIEPSAEGRRRTQKGGKHPQITQITQIKGTRRAQRKSSHGEPRRTRREEGESQAGASSFVAFSAAPNPEPRTPNSFPLFPPCSPWLAVFAV